MVAKKGALLESKWRGDARRKQPSKATGKEPEFSVLIPTLAFQLPASAGLDGRSFGVLRMVRSFDTTIVRVEEVDMNDINNPKKWHSFHSGNRYWVLPASVEVKAINNGSFFDAFAHLFKLRKDYSESKSVELTYQRRPPGISPTTKLSSIADGEERKKEWDRRRFSRLIGLLHLGECKLECERVKFYAVQYPAGAPKAWIGSPSLEWVLREIVGNILAFAGRPILDRRPLYEQRKSRRLLNLVMLLFQRPWLEPHLASLDSHVYEREAYNREALGSQNTKALNCRYTFGFSILVICRNPAPELLGCVLPFLPGKQRIDAAAPVKQALIAAHREATQASGSSAFAGGRYEIPARGCHVLLPRDVALIAKPPDVGNLQKKEFLRGVENLQCKDFLWALQPADPPITTGPVVREWPEWLRAAAAPSSPGLRPMTRYSLQTDEIHDALEQVGYNDFGD